MNVRESKAAPWRSVICAAAGGAIALTTLHETARRVFRHMPRIDVIGSRAVVRSWERVGGSRPGPRSLYAQAIAADVVSNGAVYALVGVGEPRHAYRRGLIAGLLLGASALVLPPVLGLGRQPNQRTPLTQVLTVTWYTLGGLAAATAARRAQR